MGIWEHEEWRCECPAGWGFAPPPHPGSTLIIRVDFSNQGWRDGGQGEPLHFLKVGQCVVSTVRQFAGYEGSCRLPP